jgi:hypothetical protein
VNKGHRSKQGIDELGFVLCPHRGHCAAEIVISCVYLRKFKADFVTKTDSVPKEEDGVPYFRAVPFSRSGLAALPALDVLPLSVVAPDVLPLWAAVPGELRLSVGPLDAILLAAGALDAIQFSAPVPPDGIPPWAGAGQEKLPLSAVLQPAALQGAHSCAQRDTEARLRRAPFD